MDKNKCAVAKGSLHSTAVVITTLLTTLPTWAAPPNFDAGGLLDQLKRQSASQPASSLPNAAPQVKEMLKGFAFRELPEHLVPVASDFLRPYVGKEVHMASLMQSLYIHLQGRNSRDNYIFTPRKVDSVHVLIAPTVVFDCVTVETNASRSSNDFLARVMGYQMEPQAALDFTQIERNAFFIREMPGIVSQFNLKPGASSGSSNVHLSADQGAFYGGSVTEDNSSTRSLGEWTTRADVAAYNRLGLADIIRVNGQVTRHSQSVGIDASATVHPSGLRSGINLATFHYGYRSEAEGTPAGNPQQTRSHYTGVSNSAGLNFTYPRLRSDEARQNLSLDLNYNTSVSDVAAQDNRGERSLGNFAKSTVYVQYSQGFKLAGKSFDGLPSGDLQFTHRNLAAPEKADLGGIYKMQGWGPQAVGAQQVAYIKAQTTTPVASMPGVAVGVFAERATFQLSQRNYTTTVGTQTVSINTGWQTLSDVGIMITHAPRANISLSAALAKKVGKNPIVNGSRIQEDGTVRG